jgi:hypothetical protein
MIASLAASGLSPSVNVDTVGDATSSSALLDDTQGSAAATPGPFAAASTLRRLADLPVDRGGRASNPLFIADASVLASRKIRWGSFPKFPHKLLGDSKNIGWVGDLQRSQHKWRKYLHNLLHSSTTKCM